MAGILGFAGLEVLDSGEQDAGVADQAATRLEQDLESAVLPVHQQRREVVLDAGRRFVAMRG